MKIGNIKLKGRAVLAPMAGVADRAFREFCVEYGAAYVIGEMASSKGISMRDKKSAELLYVSEKERPSAVQIFGNDPEAMAEAAKMALEYQPDAIDINMGCPAPKISGNGGGSALMREPTLVYKIVNAIVNSVAVPVTVKMRSGWDEAHINAVEIAKLCEKAGASALTVHGRTKMQMYAPPVNLDIIKQVTEAVQIPVIGNGDITCGQEAHQMLQKTGCSAGMVGRGALGRPWIFSQINAYLENGQVLPEPPIEYRMGVLKNHIEKLCTYKGDTIGMREARKHAAWYIKGIRGAAKFRNEIGKLQSLDELYRLCEKVVISAQSNSNIEQEDDFSSFCFNNNM
ncbi:putative tRNA-dihydrouridine synthase [bioreactor metagenome]|uniref:Putative tRNA-dihydrouridine synthase n=1 Tax=bioreactor metagenome TaxID=1076179 RepID=A0A645DTR0_9ZZZZ